MVNFKDTTQEFEYQGKKYVLAFNLNTMADIEDKYGSIAKWGEMVDASNIEKVNISALRYGLMCMINEGIDIENENNGTHEPFITEKQAGRIILALTAKDVAEKMNDIVVESVKTQPKNT